MAKVETQYSELIYASYDVLFFNANQQLKG